MYYFHHEMKWRQSEVFLSCVLSCVLSLLDGLNSIKTQCLTCQQVFHCVQLCSVGFTHVMR